LEREIKINEEYYFSYDDTYSDLIKHHILKLSLYHNGENVTDIEIVPLWKSISNFSEGDYLQNTILSFKQRQGYATKMHEYLKLMRSSLPVDIKNLYSNDINDQNYFSTDIKPFWEKQVKNKKAELIVELNRYKLIF